MTVGTTQLAPGNGHNYIINGAFDFWQRGDNVTVSTGAYGADRWRAVLTVDMDKSTDTPSSDFKYSAKVTAPDATVFHGIRTRLEAEHCYLLAGKDVTISFWIKANQDAIDNNGYATLHYATGATDDDWSSQTQIGSNQTYQDLGLTADTWQKVSYTATAPTSATKGIAFSILANGAVTGTGPGIIYITGVQLEAGSVATPFKRNANSIAGELAACQRYYERLLGPQITNAHYYSSTLAIGVIPYTTKRTSPAVSASSETDFRVYSSGSLRATSAITFISPGFESVQIQATTSSATAGNGAWIQVQNDEYIELDSEL